MNGEMLLRHAAGVVDVGSVLLGRVAHGDHHVGQPLELRAVGVEQQEEVEPLEVGELHAPGARQVVAEQDERRAPLVRCRADRAVGPGQAVEQPPDETETRIISESSPSRATSSRMRFAALVVTAISVFILTLGKPWEKSG